MTDRNELERLLADDKAARAYGGFPDCLAEHLRNNAQHYLSLIDEVERLRGQAAKKIMEGLWPLLGGDQLPADNWHEINTLIRQALGETHDN